MGNNLGRPTAFEAFYPELASELAQVRDEQCSSAYATYRSSSSADELRLCDAMMHCLLHNVSEVTKPRMATTSIFLGLTPTVLSMLGSSTVELCILSTHRPFLAFCITLGSPTVWPMRPFQQVDLREEMEVRHHRRKIPVLSPVVRNLVTIMQYVAVLGSIGNVVSIAYELGWKTIIFAFGCRDRYGPLIVWLGRCTC